MKHLRLALVLSALTLGLAHAQDEEQERQRAPTEIPDFSNLDEYIYVPQSTVTLGFRHLSGAKTSFSGHGTIAAPEAATPATGGNIDRVYHDGAVHPDARFAPRLDASGNPIVDPASGSAIFEPIAPDGKTNTWNFSDASQVTPDANYIAFHTYSADITDSATRQSKSGSSNGLDLSMARDMGKLFHGRMPWALTVGMTVNDISGKMSGTVQSNVTTVTDYYSLYGQVAPTAPYTAPSNTSQTALDANGNPVFNSDGSTATVAVDTTVLLGNQPAGRTTNTAADTTSVTNHWKVKGAYYTFRAGPTIWIPITTRLKASISVGVALVYSGTTYEVIQSFTPALGAEITDTNTSAEYKLLPGYYADASLQFDLTDRTGFYAGAVFQSAGSYTQNVSSTTADYATKIDLSNQSGLRAGMSIRF